MEEKKKRPKIKLRLIFGIVAVIVIAVVALFAYQKIKSRQSLSQAVSNAIIGSEGEAEVTFTESELKEVFEISELSTSDYTYNSIAAAYADKKDKDGNQVVRYHVSYEGVVKMGIDFEKIEIAVDSEKKEITLTLPEVEVTDTAVDASSMDYIFTDEKYETEDIAQEAYRICCEDLQEKSTEKPELYETAKENAESVTKALIEPWVKQADSEYTVTVK